MPKTSPPAGAARASCRFELPQPRPGAAPAERRFFYSKLARAIREGNSGGRKGKRAGGAIPEEMRLKLERAARTGKRIRAPKISVAAIGGATAGEAIPDELAAIDREANRLRIELERLEADVPSSPWVDAADIRGEQFPPAYDGKTRGQGEGGDKAGDKGNERPERPGRPGSSLPGFKLRTRMIVSTVTARYTPPNNLSDEDHLDQMTPDEAEWYRAPGSCGCVVAFRDV